MIQCGMIQCGVIQCGMIQCGMMQKKVGTLSSPQMGIHSPQQSAQLHLPINPHIYTHTRRCFWYSMSVLLIKTPQISQTVMTRSGADRRLYISSCCFLYASA